MSNQGTACKKFWGVPVQNATNPPPPLYAQNPLWMGIPGNSPKKAVFEPGIPMGIPTIPDLGNSRFGNSR